jgi:hypothetical protein
MPKDANPLIAGFLAGVASTTLLLPLDVIKVSGDTPTPTRRMGERCILALDLVHNPEFSKLIAGASTSQ